MRPDKEYEQGDGRRYGETTPEHQKQSDLGFFNAGKDARKQLGLLAIVVNGVVRRIYEIDEWHSDGGKWRAEGRRVDDDPHFNITDRYPGYPLTVGTDVGAEYGVIQGQNPWRILRYDAGRVAETAAAA